MTRVVGASNATLAVATPAQAFVLAGLVRLGTAAAGAGRDPHRWPPPNSWPTTWRRSPEPGAPGDRAPGGGLPGLGDPALRAGEPRRVHHGPPAPAAVAAGRARAATPGRRRRRPEIVVAPIKAVLQRLGPVADGGPAGGRWPRATVSTSRSWWPSWWPWATGASRSVEHRGELAVRGGIVDVFPSTADEPVRIDLWGDEVDRLTRFDVADQRSIDDLDAVELFGCRELVPDEAMRERAAELVGPGPVGPAPVGPAGRRRAVRRDGVVAAVAGRRRGAGLRPVGRRRPGGAGRAPAGAGPGRRAARRGGGPGRRPGLHLGTRGRRRRPPAARALRPAARPAPRPACVSLVPSAEGPDIPLVESPGLGADPRATGPGWPPRCRRWSTTGTRWCSARRRPEAPSGWPASWPRRG